MTPIHYLLSFDGFVFTVVGAVVLAKPSASAAALPPEGGNTPHVRDSRRLLASAYLSAGLFLLLFGLGSPDPATLRWACLLRALSLLTLTGVNIGQVRNGNWRRGALIPYLVAFPLMTLAYLRAAM
jgi:hypothetical protein